MGSNGWRLISKEINGTTIGPDNVTLKGRATEIKFEPDGDWCFKVIPYDEFNHLLINTKNSTNKNNRVECEIQPIEYVNTWKDSFKKLDGKEVTIVGVWVEDLSHTAITDTLVPFGLPGDSLEKEGGKTELHPITSILVEEIISKDINDLNEKKEIEFWVFSDASGLNSSLHPTQYVLKPQKVPFQGENRIGRFKVEFPYPSNMHISNAKIEIVEEVDLSRSNPDNCKLDPNTKSLDRNAKLYPDVPEKFRISQEGNRWFLNGEIHTGETIDSGYGPFHGISAEDRAAGFYYGKIRLYWVEDPEKIKKTQEGIDNLKKKVGCFIATATMGNYEHPLVKRLSEFRDDYLLNRKWGKQFVRHYYKYAPYFAGIISKSKFLRKISYFVIVMPAAFIAKKLLRSKK